MDYQHIQYESLDRVARISHARPHRRNAQNVELLDELDHGL
jgi:1,4-dihydroxy-2-naphthoyl-CoA synthase